MKLALTCLVVTISSVAAAQPANHLQHVMPGITATSEGGMLDVRGDFTHVNDTPGDPTLFSFTAFGQYVTRGGFGFYGSIPVAYVAQDDAVGRRNSNSGIGNLELGGLFVSHNSPTMDIFVRGGFALDTAGNDITGLAPLALFVPQPYNFLSSGFNSDWLRIHGGLRSKGHIHAGVEGGLDFPLDDGLRNDISSVFVLTGAIGVSQPGFGLSGGLTYLLVSGDGPGNSNDDTLGLNVVLDFNVGPRTKLYGALGANLEDNNDSSLGLSLGFGARFGIGD